jgi:ubiquinone/menaquinone biosynthesis C-methylase UbiE
MTNKTQDFWDKQAKRYDSSEKQFELVYKEVIARTKKYINTDDSVLDFGCATGTRTIQLADVTRHIHGLDISTEMINEAIKKTEKTNIENISFSQGTIYSNDFDTASFNTIIAYGIIHLLEEKEKVMRRVYELLKPGGFFISTTACFRDKMTFKTSMAVKAHLFFIRLGILPLHLNMFSSDDMKELIEKHNFQIVETEKISYGIPSLFVVARKL